MRDALNVVHADLFAHIKLLTGITLVVAEAYIIDMDELGEQAMKLKIIVPIKWIPNTTSVNIDPKTGTLIRANVPSIVNPPDLNALEAALKLKDKYGATVTAISMAPPNAKLGLEHAIGMGADNGILISDRFFAGADTLATSYTLAMAIKKIGDYDLIITGQETLDSSTAHIGAQTASWLQLPFIYYVTDLDANVSEKKIIVKRVLEERKEIYEIKLPALISIAMKSNKPRHVSLIHKIRAKTEKTIKIWSNQTLNLDPSCIGLKGSPTIVSKIDFIGTVPRKKTVIKKPSLEEAITQLINDLLKENALNI